MMLLGSTTVTVERPGAQTIVAGEVLDGAITTFTVKASVQPIGGREREDLPEGYRTRGRYKMYQKRGSRLQTTNLETNQREDIVLYDGRRFEVVAWSAWTDHVAPTRHHKYLLAELGADE